MEHDSLQIQEDTLYFLDIRMNTHHYSHMTQYFFHKECESNQTTLSFSV